MMSELHCAYYFNLQACLVFSFFLLFSFSHSFLFSYFTANECIHEFETKQWRKELTKQWRKTICIEAYIRLFCQTDEERTKISSIALREIANIESR